MGKSVVGGFVERKGHVRVAVSSTRKEKPLQEFVKEHVESGSNLYSDALKSYEGLGTEYTHQVIDHAEKYVEGQVHTNGLENFWSLLKRALKGTYIAVEPFHLFRYVDEQVFRYNNRATKQHVVKERDRSQMAMSRIANRPITSQP